MQFRAGFILDCACDLLLSAQTSLLVIISLGDISVMWQD